MAAVLRAESMLPDQRAACGVLLEAAEFAAEDGGWHVSLSECKRIEERVAIMAARQARIDRPT
jgi:hypothetical protein